MNATLESGTVAHTLPNGNEKTYRIVDGTYYDARTPDKVIAVLESARKSGTAIRVHYGTTESHLPSHRHPIGQDWHDEYDVTGTVSRSLGPHKIPLIVSPTGDGIGGMGILDHCIVRIRVAGKGSHDLYRHPSYRQGVPSVRSCQVTEHKRTFTAEVLIDGTPHARFKDAKAANRWIAKMGFKTAS